MKQYNILYCIRILIAVIALALVLVSCTTFYHMWRLVRWDTAEVYVINFKDQPVTVELEGNDGKRTITVDPFDQERVSHFFHFTLTDPATGKMNFVRHGWEHGFPEEPLCESHYPLYDTTELEPVVTYRHIEGPESLTSIRILDGESLLFDIPFDGSQADEDGVFWSGPQPFPVSRAVLGEWSRSPKHNLPFQEMAGVDMLVVWEEAEEFGHDVKIDVPEYRNTIVERFADLTNPKIYILVGEGAYQGRPGPAGGMVFYENPNWEADGWRYLEAAPEDWHEGASDSLPWGGRGISVGETDFGVGTGKESTQAIITFWEEWRQHRIDNPAHSDDYTEGFNYSAETVQAHLAAGRIPLSVVESNNPYEWTWIEQYAARASAEYSVTIDGVTYDDWFLPSSHEMNRMFENLRMHGLGSFASAWYWSSSEVSDRQLYAVRKLFGDVDSVPRVSDGFAKVHDYRVRPIRAYE